MNRLRVILPSIFLLITSISSHANNYSDAQGIVNRTLVAWNKALNSKDADTFIDLFTIDAVLFAPGGNTITGIDEIHDFIQSLDADLYLHDHKVEVTSIRITDKQIFISGKWNAAAANKTIKGNLIYIMEKQYDGNWRTRFVKWN